MAPSENYKRSYEEVHGAVVDGDWGDRNAAVGTKTMGRGKECAGTSMASTSTTVTAAGARTTTGAADGARLSGKGKEKGKSEDAEGGADAERGENVGGGRGGGSSDSLGDGGGGNGRSGGGGRSGGSGGVDETVTREVAFSRPLANPQQHQRINERRIPSSVTPRDGSREYDLESLGEHSREASSYVWRVLVYLLLVSPFLCLFNTLYTALALLLSTFTFPVRSFLSSNARFLSRSTHANLAFLLLLHLRFIYPGKPRRSTLPVAEDFAGQRLVLVHVFGPFVAPFFSIGAGVLVLLWVYTEVLLGERNDGGGAEYRGVMFVKGKWEEYILNGLKPKYIDSS
ncbi:unnamed protein product [Tuber melanosporum]|uniref:(Perigord truffle) hypothetical protein n=1 Tax=Tuber melanosporum (strain Mel28) TaxID=656061 RepID=D5G748_TUBMM|nr:uncharacterized protein GSTUM_00002342001 [Tuber melanosporum]CAZ80341.1 unnamed protein product [Tuber melanosporum]